MPSKTPRVGGGVAARRAADRRLVDVDHLVDVLESADARRSGRASRARRADALRERAVERVVHERGLARAGDARHRRRRRRAGCAASRPSGCARGSRVRTSAFSARLAALRRHRDRAPAGEVVAGQRVGVRSSVAAACPRATIRPPWMPAPGPMSITQSAARIVSSSCSTTITLLPWSRRRRRLVEQARVVARVEADRGLVEDVEHAHQARADLRREPDALRPRRPRAWRCRRSRVR